MAESSNDKKVIAVDFDDVILPFSQGFVDYHNVNHATNVTYDDWYTWEVHEVFGCDAETIAERMSTFLLTPEHNLLEPLPGTKDALAELSRTNHLEIVTSRQDTSRNNVHEWINLHFPKTFRQVHFTNSFAAKIGQVKRAKSEVCLQIGAQLLIEDALSHAEEVAKIGIPVLLPDRPWNREHTPVGVTRVHSWSDIVDWVENNLKTP